MPTLIATDHLGLTDRPRVAPPADPPACPGWFTWSAFGASYPDTYCAGDGNLQDADADFSTAAGISCPMCSPASFWEYMFGGQYVVPTCGRCEQMLPSGTPIVFSEIGRTLRFSAHCPNCAEQTWVIMRGYENLLPEDQIPQWEPAK